MGTHPIFESDFDCLTDRKPDKMTNPKGTRRGTRYMFSKDFRKKGVIGLKTYFANYHKETSSTSRVMVPSRRVCPTRSTTKPPVECSTSLERPSVLSSTRSTTDELSPSESTSESSTSDTQSRDRVSLTESSPTTPELPRPRRPVPSLTSSESTSSPDPLTPSSFSAKNPRW